MSVQSHLIAWKVPAFPFIRNPSFLLCFFTTDASSYCASARCRSRPPLAFLLTNCFLSFSLLVIISPMFRFGPLIIASFVGYDAVIESFVFAISLVGFLHVAQAFVSLSDSRFWRRTRFGLGFYPVRFCFVVRCASHW